MVSKASEGGLVTPSSPGRLDKEEVPDSQTLRTDDVGAVLQEQKGSKTDEENYEDRSSEDSSNRCKFDAEGSTHQRSRSNEMDYVSLRSGGRRRPRLHSFRSPSGSMQTFKPLGTSCRDAVSPPADTNMGSPVGRGDSLAKSDDATLSASRSEPRESSGGEGENPDAVLGDQFSLLKEFDSSLWSNYSLDNPRYSDY